MNEQELIERLRDEYIVVSRTETADCIEQLVKERDELGRKLNTARYGQPDFAWSIHEEELADLRVKLTKAVKALRSCVSILDAVIEESGRSIEWGEEDPFRMGEWFIDDMVSMLDARTTLAELEGEKIA